VEYISIPVLASKGRQQRRENVIPLATITCSGSVDLLFVSANLSSPYNKAPAAPADLPEKPAKKPPRQLATTALTLKMVLLTVQGDEYRRYKQHGGLRQPLF
jgi:hypothetical protein